VQKPGSVDRTCGIATDLSTNPYTNDLVSLVDVGEGDLVINSGTDVGQVRGLYAEYFLGVDTVFINELIPEIRNDPDGLVDEWRERNARGSKLLIYAEAVNYLEDLDWLNDEYGLDIGPDEVRDFLDENTNALGHYNMSSYLQFTPKE